MIVKENRLLNVLGKDGVQFRVPPYQRLYSWTDPQCEDLWRDALRAGAQNKPHFTGSFLYSPDKEEWNGIKTLEIIDGQQRMTTTVLLLVALVDWLDEGGSLEDGTTATDIRQRFLLTGADFDMTKLVLNHLDRNTLVALVYGLEVPLERSHRLLKTWRLYHEKMANPGFNPNILWRGLQLLEVVDIELEDGDRPQSAFESLNAKGMRLSVGELVRNAILATAGDQGERLYRSYWSPMEKQLEVCSENFTPNDLIIAWLASLYPKKYIEGEQEIYNTFTSHLNSHYSGSLENLLADLLEYCDKFCSNSSLRNRDASFAKDWAACKPRGLAQERMGGSKSTALKSAQQRRSMAHVKH